MLNSPSNNIINNTNIRTFHFISFHVMHSNIFIIDLFRFWKLLIISYRCIIFTNLMCITFNPFKNKRIEGQFTLRNKKKHVENVLMVHCVLFLCPFRSSSIIVKEESSSNWNTNICFVESWTWYTNNWPEIMQFTSGIYPF